MRYTTNYTPKMINFYIVAYKFLAILLGIFMVTTYVGYSYYNDIEYKRKIIEDYMPPTREPVIKEVIRYVEKADAVPTWKLVQHLNGRLNQETAKVIATEVDLAHVKYGLPKKLIIAIMKKESDLNPLARSRNSKGAILARGLMQIFAKWHPEKMKGISLEQLYHIDININMGCQIFRDYYDKSDGDLTETFHSYLSKRASKSDAKKYMDEILKWWAVLEMYEYNKEANPLPKGSEEKTGEEH